MKFSGAAVLTGGGQITTTNQRLNVITSGSAHASLTNVNNTIAGAGYLGTGRLTFTNEAAGVVDAVGSSGLVVHTAGVLANAGLLEATKGVLVLSASTIDDTSGGVIEAFSGGRVDLSSVDIIGGAVEDNGTGKVVTTFGTSEFDGSSSPLKVVGHVRIGNGTSLMLDGNIHNTGELTLGATVVDEAVTRVVIGSGGATLTGGGLIFSSSLPDNRIVGASSAATLDNVDNRIVGAGLLGNGELTLINESGGVIRSFSSTAFVIDTGANTMVNAGLIAGNGSGGLTINSAVDNTGTIFAARGDVTVNGAVTGSGVAFVNAATLAFASSFSENVTFGGTSGVLKLAHSTGYSGVLRDFSHIGRTTLDLGDIAFGAGAKASYSGTTSGGVLSVTDGTRTAHIHFAGNYLGATFLLSSDGGGGTDVVDPPAASANRLITAMAQVAPGGAIHSMVSAREAMATPMIASPGVRIA
jgi:hypothetical protein